MSYGVGNHGTKTNIFQNTLDNYFEILGHRMYDEYDHLLDEDNNYFDDARWY